MTVRSLFRSVHDAAVAAVDPGPTEADRQRRQLLRRTQADLIGKIAAAVRAYGALLAAEVDGQDLRWDEATLASSLWALRAARADATDLLLQDPREPASEWDLNSDLAQAVDRLLIELDLGEHTRTREDAAPGPGGRPAAPGRWARSRCCATPAASRPAG